MSSLPTRDQYITEGKRVFAWYFNASIQYPDFQWTMGSMENYLNEKYKNGPSFFELLGKFSLSPDGYNGTKLDDDEIEARMEAIAKKGQGKLPTEWSVFMKAVFEPNSQSLIDTMGYALLNPAIAVMEAVQDTGKAIMFAGFSGMALIGGVALVSLLVMTKFSRA